MDLKIKFSKYDYFGILIPGFILLGFILISFPNNFYIELTKKINQFGELKYVSIFLIGICIVIISYITGILISALGSWLIERKLVKNKLKYQIHHLFKSEKSEKQNKWLKIYKQPYSKQFQDQFNKVFTNFFTNIEYDDSDKFKLCFTVVKDHCPITYGRLSTFISLYNLARNLSITFVLILPIILFNTILFNNYLILIGLILTPLLSLFFFYFYLKYFKIYADEIFRSFYVYGLKKFKKMQLKV